MLSVYIYHIVANHKQEHNQLIDMQILLIRFLVKQFYLFISGK